MIHFQQLAASVDSATCCILLQDHMATTLETFVGARLAIDKDRKEVPADLTAEDDALVNLLSGAGVTDPQGRAHFVAALREHLLSTQARPNTASGNQASSQTDVGSDEEAPRGVRGDTTTGAETQSTDGQLVDASVEAAIAGKASSQKRPPLHGHTHHGISSHGHRAFLVDEETASGNDAKQR